MTRSVQLLTYTDDINIIARTKRDMIQTFLTLGNAANEMGLQINTDKTRYMQTGVQKRTNWVTSEPNSRPTQHQNQGYVRLFGVGVKPDDIPYSAEKRIFWHKYNYDPVYHMYWSSTPGLGFDQIPEVISLKKYEEINKYRHLKDNLTITEDYKDSFIKGRPFFDTLCKTFAEADTTPEFLAIDKMVIPFKIKVRRWARKNKRHIEISRPNAVTQYKRFIGGVDLTDHMIVHYPHALKNEKFYMRIVFHFMNVALVNAWILFRQSRKFDIPLIEFKASVNSVGIEKRAKGAGRNRRELIIHLERHKTGNKENQRQNKKNENNGNNRATDKTHIIQEKEEIEQGTFYMEWREKATKKRFLEQDRRERSRQQWLEDIKKALIQKSIVSNQTGNLAQEKENVNN
ncbi:hypothetical protein ILUMI_12245 [Ignelater luminosus]|uniref:Reverse transcriptase domain-containing protein n=1 Tax=Ignelater luminosus TaxID=2038154 RepID=A0A8K0CZY0_IGNLU|nr:hypothetical protein ILUMI_12245 [Ignelater luminosus]